MEKEYKDNINKTKERIKEMITSGKTFPQAATNMELHRRTAIQNCNDNLQQI
jgi:hypothetical protein